MKAQQIISSEAFKRCAEFHGHVCPGLSIGFRAALERLKDCRAEDEEIVAVVENDSCFVDAVQVLTGCTLGKGNLIQKDYGKLVLSLVSRRTGQGVRVSLLPDAFPLGEADFSLFRKVRSGQADDEGKKLFNDLHFQRSCYLLEMPDSRIFAITMTHMELPAKARIEPSEPCGQCGEPTMRTKLEPMGHKKICRYCLGVSRA